MYRSKHDPSKPLTGSTFGISGTTQSLGAGRIKKREGATFGKNPKCPDPKTYLKGSGFKLPEKNRKSDFRYDDRQKPPLPRRNEHPPQPTKAATTKNFITTNAVEAILQQAPAPKASPPNYLEKEDYGACPAYLQQVKEEIKRENEMIDAYVKEQMNTLPAQETTEEVLPEEERLELIEALKIKWDAVNAKYQKMTHNVTLDTVGKIKRKEAMENELKTLEADIGKLEKASPPIYVRAD